MNKIADFYQSHFGGITSTQHQQKRTPEMEQALKQWNYTVRLTHWLYEVGCYGYIKTLGTLQNYDGDGNRNSYNKVTINIIKPEEV